MVADGGVYVWVGEGGGCFSNISGWLGGAANDS